MEINGKFLVGFRNYNKDKQVSVIVFENTVIEGIITRTVVAVCRKIYCMKERI